MYQELEAAEEAARAEARERDAKLDEEQKRLSAPEGYVTEPDWIMGPISSGSENGNGSGNGSGETCSVSKGHDAALPGATEGSTGVTGVFQAAALGSGAPLSPQGNSENGVGNAANMETNVSCVTAH